VTPGVYTIIEQRWQPGEEEHMKKRLFILFVLIPASILAVAYADQKAATGLKVGDEVYVCDCGMGCKCNMMANKAGNCACGEALVKAKVVRMKEGTVYIKADNWKEERPFKTTGKYTCACGPTCGCNAISQNPGKCPCGMEMKKAE
jgi:hypothetical protein